MSIQSGKEASPLRHLLAGVLGGLAFATCYAFVITLPLGAITAFASSRGPRRWTSGAAHAAGGCWCCRS